MITSESAWPRVVRKPTRATSPVISALSADVVPCAISSVSPSSSAVSRPSVAASSPTIAITPREKSGGVDGVFAAVTVPRSSVATASVNVPPMSIPMT
jgi:hypothetical protein